MLTRSIDLDEQFDPSFEEKLFYNAKRLCVGFAVAALSISGLDLMNIRPLENAAEYIHLHRHTSVAEWPQLIRSGIQQISFAVPSATAAIPSDFAIARPTAAVAGLARDTSPVAELAAAREQDAVELAMEQPPVMAKASTSDLARQAQDMLQRSRDELAANPPPANSGAIQLASVDPNVMPQSAAAQPAVMQVSLPAHIAVLPPPAPGVPPPSPAQRLHLEGKERAKAELCLSNAIYFEARDQPYIGQVAVAQVVMNRVFSGVYPRDVCGVIYQNANRHLACQFTFACDGKRKTINEFGSWARARRIARETLDGQLYVQAVGTSTHYHATYVHPNWVHEMRRFAREGIHLFYRPIAWGNGSDEPIWSRAQLASNKQAAATTTTAKKRTAN
ncbi:MAG TPA: cell wall hydrolase [Pseudolabrys sp.]|nr:cell wall hydrolase [Pseudolabrys sp.]